MKIEMKLAGRATKEWSKLVGLPLQAAEIAEWLYAFGTELAVLRLHHKMGVGRVGYSEAQSSWYYVQEIRFRSTPSSPLSRAATTTESRAR